MLALKEMRPSARCVYLGDTAHFPYGEKPPAVIAECAAEAVRLIVRLWSPRALVVACNTISVTALSALRGRFPGLPMVGTVPAIKLASRLSVNRRIGLLATNATVSNPYTDGLVAEFASDCEVWRRGDPELVRFVERDFFTSGEEGRRNACRPAADFFAARGCDVIVLACTHFTHIASAFQSVVGPSVRVIDSRDGVARQTLRICPLPENEGAADKMSAAPRDSPPDCSFFVTAADSAASAEYRALCGNCGIPWGGVVPGQPL